MIIEQRPEGFALLVREASVAAIGGGVRQVDLGMGDVEVTTNDDGLLLR